MRSSSCGETIAEGQMEPVAGIEGERGTRQGAVATTLETIEARGEGEDGGVDGMLPDLEEGRGGGRRRGGRG